MNVIMPFSEHVSKKLEGGMAEKWIRYLSRELNSDKKEDSAKAPRFGRATEGLALGPWSPLQAR